MCIVNTTIARNSLKAIKRVFMCQWNKWTLKYLKCTKVSGRRWYLTSTKSFSKSVCTSNLRYLLKWLLNPKTFWVWSRQFQLIVRCQVSKVHSILIPSSRRRRVGLSTQLHSRAVLWMQVVSYKGNASHRIASKRKQTRSKLYRWLSRLTSRAIS